MALTSALAYVPHVRSRCRCDAGVVAHLFRVDAAGLMQHWGHALAMATQLPSNPCLLLLQLHTAPRLPACSLMPHASIARCHCRALQILMMISTSLLNHMALPTGCRARSKIILALLLAARVCAARAQLQLAPCSTSWRVSVAHAKLTRQLKACRLSALP